MNQELLTRTINTISSYSYCKLYLS